VCGILSSSAASGPSCYRAPEASLQDVPEPSEQQLRMLGFASALPFIGFGFLDNFLMICLGDLIDGTLCVMLSFSTLAAAALGNTMSDVAGIFSGGCVEQVAERYGVKEPPLTRDQKLLFSSRRWQYSGQALGVVLGCILGSCPLLWIDAHEAERRKKLKEQDAILQSVVDKAGAVLRAEAACFLLVDVEKHDLYSRNVTSNLRHFRWGLSDGLLGPVASTGFLMNVSDVHDEPSYYNPKLHDNFLGCGIKVQSVLAMPVFSNGRSAGVLAVLNKDSGSFSALDEDILSAISTHVSVTLGDCKQNFDEIFDLCTKSVAQQRSYQWDSASRARGGMLFVQVLKGMKSLLQAQSVALMLLDEKRGELFTEAVEDNFPKVCTRREEGGFAWRAVESGRVMNLGSNLPGGVLCENYQSSGIDLQSVLSVPIFDTSRNCLGVIVCFNKMTTEAFSDEDIQYTSQVATYIALMLEGPTAELKRVLALTRQRMQDRGVHQPAGGERRFAVVCFLERAED
ncbi:unnamed protein product, partial [Polarella glacialis]